MIFIIISKWINKFYEISKVKFKFKLSNKEYYLQHTNIKIISIK